MECTLASISQAKVCAYLLNSMVVSAIVLFIFKCILNTGQEISYTAIDMVPFHYIFIYYNCDAKLLC